MTTAIVQLTKKFSSGMDRREWIQEARRRQNQVPTESKTKANRGLKDN